MTKETVLAGLQKVREKAGPHAHQDRNPGGALKRETPARMQTAYVPNANPSDGALPFFLLAYSEHVAVLSPGSRDSENRTVTFRLWQRFNPVETVDPGTRGGTS
jgi:hypothetical protein